MSSSTSSGQPSSDNPHQADGAPPTAAPVLAGQSSRGRRLSSATAVPHRRRWRRAAAATAALAVIALTAWAVTDHLHTGRPGGSDTSLHSPLAQRATTPALAEVSFSVGYAGDVLMHMPVLESTPQGSGDISSLVAAQTPWVEGVDLALCGLEVPVAPDGMYSGYPSFGMPGQVVTSLAGAGWDGCATASNHSVDRGQEGVEATLDALEANGMGHAGTFRSAEDAGTPFQLYDIERGGRTITIAQIATTHDLNGYEDPTGSSVGINDAEAVKQAAIRARAAGADLVVAHAQVGPEYDSTPHPDQIHYAQALANTAQIDAVFGAHPHVPQPSVKLEGGVEGRGMWVSYSAGNYISNQDEEAAGLLSDVGLFVWIDVTAHSDGTVTVDGLNWRPFTMDTAAGHLVRDLAALHEGQRPEGLQISEEEIERRWSALMGFMDPATMAQAPATPSGPVPVVLTEEQIRSRAAQASASPEPSAPAEEAG
ncbi:CapA family protein [Actinomyces bowdenii]|uniref:CapA family protein n=1 Tax=Actinomyces bowdenii TaxID=131109 RepID=UPI00312C70D0